MAEMVDKVYCMDRPADNAPMWASLMANKDNSAELAAMLNSQNNQWNNPFMYLIWLALFGNGGFGFGNRGAGAQGVEINGQLSAIRETMNTNQNSNLLMDAIKGNHAAIHELAGNLNCDFNSLSQAVCGVQNGISRLAGEVGVTGERVINSVLLGNKDLTAALQSCCCQTNQNITKMGYENQIATMNQTTQLQERLTGIGNGIQQGFSSVAYESQRQTCDVINAGNANTQRIIDTLNNHWNSELQLKYQDAKAELSQSQQTNALTSQLTAIAAAIAKIPTT